MLPFCCCCRWENGGCLVHYPVTKCLKECHNVHRMRLFVLIQVVKNDEAVFGNETGSVVIRREKLNSTFHDMTNKDAQSDQCLCCSLTR